jgi:hypothetical protein
VIVPAVFGKPGVSPVTRLHRNVNFTAVVVPFVAFLVSVPLLWNQVIGWTDLAVLAALWHAHVGWLFEYNSGRDAERFAPDLLEDRGMVWISRLFVPIVAGSLVFAFGLGYALTGELGGALTALLWGGLVRVFFLHHVRWSINSVCHFFGRRRYRQRPHERLLAVGHLLRRVMAPQPPCVPAIGVARDALVGIGSRRRSDRSDETPAPGLERRAHQSRAAGSEGGHGDRL